jgi:proteasome lid subunit RPN8/RPN11
MLPTEIWLEEIHWNQMLADVRERAPLEACGLVGGMLQCSLAVYPIDNIHQSPVRFLMDPAQQLRVFQDLDEKNWDLLAIYHSHPNGPAHPSPTDMEEAAYPEAVNLIWSRRNKSWNCRAFLIRELEYQEIPVHRTPNS